METYIRRNVKGYYIEFPEEIDTEYWEGKIGSTYEDFLDGKWVLLSDEQVAFHNEHPNATIKEVLDMEITPVPIHVRTLEEAKEEKLGQIEQYDSSDAVNSFTIKFTPDTEEGGETVPGESMTAWIAPEQRSNYKNSLDSAELLGLTEVHPVFNGMQLALPTQMAKMALAQVQIYADRCYIITETHKTNVNTLDTIEAVDAYDYTAGYPEKLEFKLYDEES